MIVQSVNNSDFQKSITLLIELQFAICQDDEDTAERLREDMEVPLRSLTWDEREWIRGVSGDLESVCGQEVIEPNPYTASEYRKRLPEAWLNIETDPETLLSLLRIEQSVLSPARVAYARARTYGILGIHPLCKVFMRLASELEPTEIAYKIFMLELLYAQGNFDELNAIIESILEDYSSDPDLFIPAAAYAFMLIRGLAPNVTRPRLGWLRERLQRFLNQLSVPVESLKRNVSIMGLHTLASVLDMLNRHRAAQEIYWQAHKLDPSNQQTEVALAFSLLRNDEKSALKMFSDLAARNTSHGIAYLFAAQSAGQQGLLEECVRLSKATLEKTDYPMVRAEAYKFLAICELQINGPTDKAQAYFEQALESAPELISVQEAFKTFHEIRKDFVPTLSTNIEFIGNPKGRIDLDITSLNIPADMMRENLSGYSRSFGKNLNAVAA